MKPHSGRCPSCGLSPYESGIGDADISRIVTERNGLIEQLEETRRLQRMEHEKRQQWKKTAKRTQEQLEAAEARCVALNNEVKDWQKVAYSLGYGSNPAKDSDA